MTVAEDRLAAARRTLERAEAAAGLRTRLAMPPRIAADDGAGWAGRDPVLGGEGGGAGLGGEGGGVGLGGEGGGAGGGLLVPTELAGFFPPGGLRRGGVVQVGGSSSLLLALLAAAQGEGWVALAALPDIGLQAAAEAGVALDRSLLVPRPGPEAASVVGALVDGVDVLAVGDCRALSARDRRLLSARLRSRGTALLSTAHWPGADVVLRAGEVRAGGLGQGWGRVETGELTVHGRSRSGVAGRVRVRLGPDGLSAVDAGGLSQVDAGGLGAVDAGGLGAVGDETGAAVTGPAVAASADRQPDRPRLRAVS